jgi:hypothetical protein
MTHDEVLALRPGDLLVVRPEVRDEILVRRVFLAFSRRRDGRVYGDHRCTVILDAQGAIVSVDSVHRPGAKAWPCDPIFLDRVLTPDERAEVDARGWCTWVIENRARMLDERWTGDEPLVVTANRRTAYERILDDQYADEFEPMAVPHVT